MDSKIIIVLAIILFILIILQHVSTISTSSNPTSQQFGYIQSPSNCSNVPGCCSLTQYGCCPDGVNSRENVNGSNCPNTYSQGYNVNTQNTVPNTPPQTVFIPPQNIIKPIIR
jgi:hypothetical protein